MSTPTKVIDEGAESTVTLTKLDDGTSFVTKTRQPQGRTQYTFEAFCYTSVAKLGSRVPTVIDVDENHLTMTAFAGETIDDQLDLYNNQEIFDGIAKDLSLNAKVVFDGYGTPIFDGSTYTGKYKTWLEFLAATYNKLQNSQLYSNQQKHTLMLKWNEMVVDIKLVQGALVHGDFALSAIFVNNNKYEGIIDYGDAFIGDPLTDLAYFRFKEITKDYGYGIYDMLSDSYSKYTNIEREYIDKATMFYMMYWAIERVHTDNLESEIIEKFLEKTQVLIEQLLT